MRIRRAQLALAPIVALLLGCAGFPWQQDPLPQAVVATDPVAGQPAQPPALSPQPPAPSPEPSAHGSRLPAPGSPDSVADFIALDQLAEALAPGGEAGDAALEALAESDNALDLTTWAEHDRVRYYLDFFQGPARSRMAVWLQRFPVYESMIRERFAEAGLPDDLVYLGLIESGYSNTAVSRSRAVGMWQFMRGTARWIGLRVDSWVDERRDPVKATDAAARYLSYLRNQFGSVYLAAAAYNAGPGTVSRGLTRTVASGPAQDEEFQGWTDEHFFTLADTRFLRLETKDYVPKLIAAALIARNPSGYGFAAPEPVDPFPRDSIVVPDMTGLDVLADLAGTSLATLRELNPHLLRLTTPPGGPAVVRLPAGTAAAAAAGYAKLPPSKRLRYREHVVKKGETLGGIANRYRISLADIRATNRAVRTSNLIRPGQVLVIPIAGAASVPAARNSAPATSSGSTAARTHLVRRGETLSALAGRYGVSVSALMEANGIRSARQLQAGKRIRIPSTSSDR